MHLITMRYCVNCILPNVVTHRTHLTTSITYCPCGKVLMEDILPHIVLVRGGQWKFYHIVPVGR